MGLHKGKPRTCRACGLPREADDLVWSPYYGGGYYHLTCDAVPTQMPNGSPSTEPCSECGWYKRRDDHFVCPRCHHIWLLVPP